MSDFVLDASLALQWFLEDEADRKYSLSVLASLSEKRAVVPILWFYEVGNGLLMAFRRKRITLDQIGGFLTRLKTLPIDAAPQTPAEILELPALAQSRGLTNYDAAYIATRGSSWSAPGDNRLRSSQSRRFCGCGASASLKHATAGSPSTQCRRMRTEATAQLCRVAKINQFRLQIGEYFRKEEGLFF